MVALVAKEELVVVIGDEVAKELQGKGTGWEAHMSTEDALDQRGRLGCKESMTLAPSKPDGYYNSINYLLHAPAVNKSLSSSGMPFLMCHI